MSACAPASTTCRPRGPLCPLSRCLPPPPATGAPAPTLRRPTQCARRSSLCQAQTSRCAGGSKACLAALLPLPHASLTTTAAAPVIESRCLGNVEQCCDLFLHCPLTPCIGRWPTAGAGTGAASGTPLCWAPAAPTRRRGRALWWQNLSVHEPFPLKTHHIVLLECFWYITNNERA